MVYKLIDKRKKIYLADLEPADLFIFKDDPIAMVYLLAEFNNIKYIVNISDGVLLSADDRLGDEVERVGYELKVYREGK